MNNASNLPSVTVQDFTEIVKLQFAEKNFRPIFGLGKGGIGKTESIEHLAKEELKIGYIDIRLLLYSETDLKGIPYPDETHTKTIWLQNDILPVAERDGEHGILVLDEITSCSRSVRTAAYQLLNERRLGEYVLPEGWMIVCLGNGEEDGGDYNGIEGNFANRCSVYNVVVDFEVWKQWAFANNINPLVAGFISFKPQSLHTYNPDKETDILFASPRGWTAVSNILNVHTFKPDDTILQQRILGNLGTEVGHTFFAFCKFKDSTVEPKDIITGRIMPDIQKQEIIYITIQSCVKLVGDALHKDAITDGVLKSEHVTWCSNLVRWLVTKLSADNAVIGLKDLIAYEGSIRKILTDSGFRDACPEFKNFMTEHAQIFY